MNRRTQFSTRIKRDAAAVSGAEVPLDRVRAAVDGNLQATCNAATTETVTLVQTGASFGRYLHVVR